LLTRDSVTPHYFDSYAASPELDPQPFIAPNPLRPKIKSRLDSELRPMRAM
jgi:hypothetical protein